MKKMYGAPKAERVEFDYSNTVVASVTPCYDTTPFSFAHGLIPACHEKQMGDPSANNEIA